MREIKFRAWDKTIKKMIQNSAYLISMLGKVYCIDDTVIDYLEFMQFTGLKDKNGKEIYEGDLVLLVCSEKQKKPQIKIVIWSNCGFNLRPYRKNSRGYKVIGNIYENPELLKPSP